jgi:hypothetical protein
MNFQKIIFSKTEIAEGIEISVLELKKFKNEKGISDFIDKGYLYILFKNKDNVLYHYHMIDLIGVLTYYEDDVTLYLLKEFKKEHNVSFPFDIIP